MVRISVPVISGIAILILVAGASAFTVSSVSITPSGTLNPGDTVNISFTVYAASGTAFPSYDDLQCTTLLDDRLWLYSISVNGVENERPPEILKTLTISGFELSYQDRDEVIVRLHLKGRIPARSPTGAAGNLVTVQELDARGYAINSTTVTISHLIGTPTPTPTPAAGSISVSSDPDGADVFLDNVYKGFSPITLEPVQNGDHTVIVKLDGYEKYSRKVTVRGDSQAVRAVLSPLATPPATTPFTGTITGSATATAQAGTTAAGGTGTLSVNTVPQGAAVFIDGEMRGNTPATIPGLVTGKHTVRLVLPGYSALNTTIAIEAGRTTEYSTGLVQPTKTPGFGVICTVLSIIGILTLGMVCRSRGAL